MENYIKPNTLNWELTKIKGFASKQLIDLANGGLKLIKVEPNSIYPFHNHPDKTEFIYVLEGTPEITIGDQQHQGERGDFFILPQTVLHSIKNNSDAHCILLVGAIKN
jgi:quercetin dioxygenase-like cupin family protein